MSGPTPRSAAINVARVSARRQPSPFRPTDADPRQAALLLLHARAPPPPPAVTSASLDAQFAVSIMLGETPAGRPAVPRLMPALLPTLLCGGVVQPQSAARAPSALAAAVSANKQPQQQMPTPTPRPQQQPMQQVPTCSAEDGPATSVGEGDVESRRAGELAAAPKYTNELQGLPKAYDDDRTPAEALPAFLGQAFVRTDVPGVARRDQMRERARTGAAVVHDTRFGVVGGRLEPPPSFSMGDGGRTSPGAQRDASPELMRPYQAVASSDEDEDD